MLFFVIVSIIGIIYFLFKRRKFDFYSIGFFSSLLYFSPGYFGEVSYSSNLILSLFCTAMLILTVGRDLIIPNKLELMSKLNVWMIFLTYTSSLTFVLSFINNQKFIFVVALILQILILVIGFRFPLVISLISVLVLSLNKFKAFKLIRYRKHLIFGLLVISITLVFKKFLFAIKTWDTDLMYRIANNEDILLSCFNEAEPFKTQSILNKVIETEFEVPLSHLDNFLALFVFESESLGIEIRSFNYYFQDELFPGAIFNMASNIWAQFYALGGWVGILFMICFYNVLLGFFSKLIQVRSTLFKATFAVMGVYWAFYLQRNSLSYIFATQKKILLLGVLILFLTKAYLYIRRPKRI